MANAFSKEERVAFEQLLEGFNDMLVMSRLVNKYSTDQQAMERSYNIIWRPMPYIAQSYAGTDMTGNFNSSTQLSVPAQINQPRSSPWVMTALELRDALQENRLGEAAKQKLSADINVAVNGACTQLGSLVVKRTSAASGFDDVAAIDSIYNEQGIGADDRYAAYASRDYNSMASNLAARQTLQGRPETAYDKAYVGEVANFGVFKMDYAPRIAAAAGGAITVSGANQFYVPQATATASYGEVTNVDNRFQTIAVSATANVQPGDCLQFAGVNSVHHITKQDTGQPKTFRVVSVVDGTHLQITPPLISAQGGSNAEVCYQNVTATPANGAAITWLNTAASALNPHWKKSAIELLPGRYSAPTDAGVQVLRATTEQGIEMTLSKFFDINTLKTLYRADVIFGVAVLNTEMCGVELFNQV
ncbi:major head protein [Ralstonia phage Firinga]|uniref:Major capsid protein n=3 Tax=Firingavirus TaxID=2843381 RepID=A0A7G5B9W0_9CAUD|nr:major head protein [Ralstonia phage RSK1]YP_010078554.1 major head protein [Ralstonia phage Firinga]QMV33083.1 major capsid protein [Ralstonia phage Firinga]QMV33323.1 major capsid protein [Ralstonia phage Hennie]BAO04669.1 putative capsid protein [Ralstonia phage RSK1]